MKKIVLGSSLLLAMVLATGCGSDGDSKVAFEDVKVAYKTSAAYDLSQYFVPAQNQISNYVENTYTNKDGNRDYSATADEDSPVYSTSQYDVNGTTIKETTDGSLETTFNILADKVIGTDASDNSVESYARYVDKDDYIIKMQRVDEDLGTVKSVCKLANHHDSKKVSGKTYADIIEFTCTIDTYDSATVGGSKVEVIGNGDTTRFFAKGKGLISTLTEYCAETKSDGTKTKATCAKVTEDITTIN